MRLQLIRPPFADLPRTISKLYVDGVLFSFVLEDRDRRLFQWQPLEEIKKIKVKHETAIPYGTYQIVMSFSNKFQKYLPLLLDVPAFDGIRVHAGNTEIDTSGCLLLGQLGKDRIINSNITINKFIPLLVKAIKTQKVYIDIIPSIFERPVF